MRIRSEVFDFIYYHVKGYVTGLRRWYGENTMSRQVKKIRRRQLDVLLSDQITDLLHDLYEKELITKAEWHNESKKLGWFLSNPELLPKYPSVRELKGRIRDRLGASTEKLLRELQRRRTLAEAKARMKRLSESNRKSKQP